jgi:3-keto-5-aminohexanoate cleavage enzyme
MIYGRGSMEGVVLTVRMNEYTSRSANPNVPWNPEELAADAAACVEAGAAIVHFHGRDPATGRPNPDAGVLSDTVKLVNDACDAITYCTLGAGLDQDRETRLASLTGAATKPDLAPVDLGSFNLDPYDPSTKSFAVDEGLYVNTVGVVRHLTEGIVAAGVRPAAVVWNIGSLRLLGALLDQGLWSAPIYAEMILSDRLLSVLPATPEGLETLLRFRPAGVPMTWTAICAGDVMPMVDTVVAAGGGLSFGLGDHPYHDLGVPTNADVVAAVVERLRLLGKRPATTDEVRQQLRLNT